MAQWKRRLLVPVVHNTPMRSIVAHLEPLANTATAHATLTTAQLHSLQILCRAAMLLRTAEAMWGARTIIGGVMWRALADSLSQFWLTVM